MNDNALQQLAQRVRNDILTMSYQSQSAHMGGALSAVEILVALYAGVMRINPKNPLDPARDRLVFSKAHDAKALYSVLCQRGFFPKKHLSRYENDDAVLPGHSTRQCVPGIEVSAGSLGHGLSMAAGMAYGIKKRTARPRVFAVLSDGECNEGSTWEAALFAGHHHLDNLIAIVDCNKLQGYGYTRDVLDLEPFASKWLSFGWSVKEADGHDTSGLIRLLRSAPFAAGRPSAVVAHTIKGLGGPKAHINKISSQYKPPTKKEYEELLHG